MPSEYVLSNEYARTDIAARLLKTGMFSDCTLELDDVHKFRIHSVVMAPKSQWFASEFNALPDQATSIFLKKDSTQQFYKPTALAIEFDCPFEHTENEIEGCLGALLVREMLRYCYTGTYEPFLNDNHTKSIWISNFLMNYMGREYKIDELVACSSLRLAETTATLTATDFQEFAIELESIHQDPRAKGEEATHETLRHQAQVMIDVANSRLIESMPNLYQDVVRATFFAGRSERYRNGLKCVRCGAQYFGLSATTRATTTTELCAGCAKVPKTLLKPYMRLPGSSKYATTMAVWECSSCSKVWSCEGIICDRKRLEACPGCPRERSGNRELPKYIDWVCRNCCAQWTASRPLSRMEELSHCVCCPTSV
jgi:hypothetical protein